MTDKKSKTAKTFTVAQLARELKMSEKLARRRMRANASRDKGVRLPSAAALEKPHRANVRYEFADTAANRKLITAIIADK